jgi:hypothetical protein
MARKGQRREGGNLRCSIRCRKRLTVQDAWCEFEEVVFLRE